MIVEQIEIKKGQKGDFKVVTVAGGGTASLFSWHSLYSTIKIGDEIDLEKSGDYTNVVDPNGKKRTGGGVESSVKRSQDTKREDIAHAQDSKAESIRISSTFRDATLLTIAEMSKSDPSTIVTMEDVWHKWRAWLWNSYDDPLNRVWIENNTDPTV